MKFYKLELINRENSYNQMFGSKPNVAMGGGAMNAMTTGPPMGVGGNGIGGMGIGGKQPLL